MSNPLFLTTLRRHAYNEPDKIAIEFLTDGAAVTLTYAELEAYVAQTMTLLQISGVSAGDRVALQLPKTLSFVILHLAIMRVGALCVPLNPNYPPRELAYFLQDADVSIFVADRAKRDALQTMLYDIDVHQTIYLDCETPAGLFKLIEFLPHNAQYLPSDPSLPCLMIYTSGTTGRPKGALLTHGNMTAQISTMHHYWGWQEDDILFHVLPIFHLHGLGVALHGALYAGATTIMPPRFAVEQTLLTLRDRRCTVFMAVPAIHRRLLDSELAKSADWVSALAHMRLLTSGSDRLPDDMFNAYRDTFGHTLLERYGMSETGMLCSNPLHGERRIGSVGFALPGVTVRIVDPETGAELSDGEVGELHVKGDNVCAGYWRQPEQNKVAFTADRFLKTGDLGVRSADGYITLKGRSKDLIISGGFNIYPPDVELVLREHPDVAAAAVVGCPDRTWGERVTAVLVVEKGALVSADEIIAFCRERLVNYKIPKRIVFVDDFPRNAIGKVQKAQLRRAICEEGNTE